MGAAAVKEIAPLVPMVLNALPVLMQQFQSTKSESSKKENEEIGRVLHQLQSNRNDIDQILNNQAQLTRTYEALNILVNRLEGNGPAPLANGARRLENGTSRIRIEIDLPDDPRERDEAVRSLWRSISRIASEYDEHDRAIGVADDPQGRAMVRAENHSIQRSTYSLVDDDCGSDCGARQTDSSFFTCEICTQPYNSRERRPTLLTKCGHTFCKECLTKEFRRRRKCPTCRVESDVGVDELPTNYSVLDFMNKDEKDKSFCKEKVASPQKDSCELSFEEQLEIATQLSLTQLSLEESKQNQNEEDYRLAQRLQEEEEKLQRFSQHEDFSEKARRLDAEEEEEEDEEFDNSFARGRGRRLGGREYPRGCSAMEVDEDTNGFGPRSVRGFDGKESLKRNSGSNFRNQSLSAKDDKFQKEKASYFHSACRVSDDDSDDCYKSRTEDGPYAEARRKLMDDSDGDACSNPHSEKPRSRGVDKGFEDGRNEVRQIYPDVFRDWRREGTEEDMDEASGTSLLDIEKESLRQRAEETYVSDRAKRKLLKKLKEQEELDMAIAMSLSEQDGSQEQGYC